MDGYRLAKSEKDPPKLSLSRMTVENNHREYFDYCV